MPRPYGGGVMYNSSYIKIAPIMNPVQGDSIDLNILRHGSLKPQITEGIHRLYVEEVRESEVMLRGRGFKFFAPIMKSEIFVRFVSCIAKEVSCLKDMILKKINDKGALLFALFILLAGGSRARQHRKDDHVIRGKQVAVFGRNIFTARNLSFEPSLDIPTPENYVLGSGDELIIDVWGASENTVREIISPEGTIHVAGIGPIFLSGMNIQDAERSLRREFSKIYAAIPQKTVHIELSLGRIRTIMINVMGEVKVPGIYRLSAFASVFHALYRAGGISDIGSLRDIRVVRDGKEIARVDVYDYIMKGKLTDNIRLSEGDVILVPPYQNLVSISGKVKRPMKYEMKSGETVATLLSYAGGFTGDAYRSAIRLFRMGGKANRYTMWRRTIISLIFWPMVINYPLKRYWNVSQTRSKFVALYIVRAYINWMIV